MWGNLDALRVNFQNAMTKHPIATLIGILIFFVLCCIADKVCNSERGKKWKNTQE